MVKIVTEQSVHYSTPAFDKDGEPIKSRIKFNNREVEIAEVDHHRVEAGVVIDVSKDVAAELLGRGLARKPDPAIDAIDAIDPINGNSDEKDDALA